MQALRFRTYLAPSIPRAFFELAVERVAAGLGVAASLDFETRVSGPTAETDPFAADQADFAFVCAPALSELRAAGSAELVGAAPVFADPRIAGRPVYFADVVAAAQSRVSRFEDLEGAVWTYNDPASLSGWHSMLARLGEIGREADPTRFFGEVVVSGSHLNSLELVASGRADASAIDSNALALRLAREPALASRLKVLESWGPLPIQPLLASSALPAGVRERAAAALLEIHEDPAARERLAACGVSRFAPVDGAFYDSFPILAAASVGQAKGR